MTQALHTLLEQAEAERDAVRARWLQAEAQARQAREQTTQLHAYRDDYRRRSPARAGRGISIELLRVASGFLQRLDQAIEQQTDRCLGAEAQAVRLRETLTACELRVASVRKLIERREADRRQREARREQQRMDEAAARLAASRRPQS